MAKENANDKLKKWLEHGERPFPNGTKVVPNNDYFKQFEKIEKLAFAYDDLILKIEELKKENDSLLWSFKNQAKLNNELKEKVIRYEKALKAYGDEEGKIILKSLENTPPFFKEPEPTAILKSEDAKISNFETHAITKPEPIVKKSKCEAKGDYENGFTGYKKTDI